MRSLIFALALLLPIVSPVEGVTKKLPTPPKDAELVRDEPIPCPEGTLYVHAFDTNPGTLAAVIVVGPAIGGKHEHGEPFLVVIINDKGIPTFYLDTGNGIKVYDQATFEGMYGPTARGACAAWPKRV